MLEILSKCWRYGFLTMTLLLVLDISWYQAWWRDARLRRMEECLTVARPTSASGAPNTTTCWPSRTRKTFWGREIWCLISLRASTSWSRTLMEGESSVPEKSAHVPEDHEGKVLVLKWIIEIIKMVGRLCPALRQNCNPPGSVCSCLVGLDSNERWIF